MIALNSTSEFEFELVMGHFAFAPSSSSFSVCVLRIAETLLRPHHDFNRVLRLRRSLLSHSFYLFPLHIQG